MAALQHFKPLTVVEWDHQSTTMQGEYIFKFPFWARPIILIDDTHVNGKYDIKLLIAVELMRMTILFHLHMLLRARALSHGHGFLSYYRDVLSMIDKELDIIKASYNVTRHTSDYDHPSHPINFVFGIRKETLIKCSSTATLRTYCGWQLQSTKRRSLDRGWNKSNYYHLQRIRAK